MVEIIRKGQGKKTFRKDKTDEELAALVQAVAMRAQFTVRVTREATLVRNFKGSSNRNAEDKVDRRTWRNRMASSSSKALEDFFNGNVQARKQRRFEYIARSQNDFW